MALSQGLLSFLFFFCTCLISILFKRILRSQRYTTKIFSCSCSSYVCMFITYVTSNYKSETFISIFNYLYYYLSTEISKSCTKRNATKRDARLSVVVIKNKNIINRFVLLYYIFIFN